MRIDYLEPVSEPLDIDVEGEVCVSGGKPGGEGKPGADFDPDKDIFEFDDLL